MKKIKLILLTVILVCVSCGKDDEGNWVTYYKTIGEGYIYDITNDKPLSDVIITVRTYFKNPWWFNASNVEEKFTTDVNGYYQLRFLKRFSNDKADRYYFTVELPDTYWVVRQTSNGKSLLYDELDADYVKNNKLITFDTLKLKPLDTMDK